MKAVEVLFCSGTSYKEDPDRNKNDNLVLCIYKKDPYIKAIMQPCPLSLPHLWLEFEARPGSTKPNYATWVEACVPVWCDELKPKDPPRQLGGLEQEVVAPTKHHYGVTSFGRISYRPGHATRLFLLLEFLFLSSMCSIQSRALLKSATMSSARGTR